MDLFKLTLNEEWEDTFQIALVDEPAIESNWQAFKDQKNPYQFKIQDEEKRIVSGYAMIADKKIPRYEEDRGGYLVVFDKQSIWDIALKFFKNKLTTQTNEMHNTGNFAKGVYVFESMILDSERGISAPKGFDQEPDGSWFISMKVENEEVWQKVKSGEYKGFSIECRFDEQPMEFDIDEFLEELKMHI